MPAITRFRGINLYRSAGTLAPDEAYDLSNVVCNLSGQLEKLRVPTDMLNGVSPVAANTQCWGFWDFQQANGTRQYIAVFGTKIWMFSGTPLAGVVIDDTASNAGRWSAVLSNNILYMANGVRMLQWTGKNLRNWGIFNPMVAPTSVAQLTITRFSRTAGVALITVASTAGLVTGDAGVIAGIQTAAFNVAAGTAITVVDATHLSYVNAGADTADTAVAPGPATFTYFTGAAGLLTFTQGGRASVITFGNSEVTHESSCTPATANSGNITAGSMRVTVDAATLAQVNADPQIDTAFLYSTQDGGGVFYLNQTMALDRSAPVASIVFKDNTPDNQLDLLNTAPFFNDPPPVGYHLKEEGGRIFIGNLVGDKSAMVYSGYEVVLRGRPEQAFPPDNRIELGVGADDLRGFGVLQTGLVAFSKSNEMFSLTGVVEDVVIGTPVAYSERLTKLPWNTGAASHEAIINTPFGLHWISAQREIQFYMGWGQASTFGANLMPLLRSIPVDQAQYSVGCYFNWLDRDWCVFGLPQTNQAGAPGQMHKIVVMDISDITMMVGYSGQTREGGSVGAFIFDVGPFDYLGILEAIDGSGPQLVIAQGSTLKSVRVISDAVHGLTGPDAPAGTANVLGSFWENGGFGNESGHIYKTFRYVQVVSDDPSKVGLVLSLINDGTHKQSNPDRIVIQAGKLNLSGRTGVNKVSRRMRVRINMPTADMSFAVQELWAGYNLTSER